MIATLWSLALVMEPAVAGDWTELYTKDEIIVSRMDLEGTRFYAFKGETVYDAPATKVMHVLMDNDHRTDWVDMLYEATVLVNASLTGSLDKVVLEGMAAGLPFVSCSDAAPGVISEFGPAAERFLFEAGSADELADE